MKSKVVKIISAMIIGFVLFCAAYIVGVVDFADVLVLEVKYNIFISKRTNLIKKEKKRKSVLKAMMICMVCGKIQGTLLVNDMKHL